MLLGHSLTFSINKVHLISLICSTCELLVKDATTQLTRGERCFLEIS